jgi:choline dehydrogenase-like flavoprotein
MSIEKRGVVEADLVLWGTKGLKVVDTSIMPLLPATHLLATVYAVTDSD